MSHYIPTTDGDRAQMLDAVGVASVAELFEVVPSELRFPPVALPPPLSEAELLRELRELGDRDANAQTHRVFLGAGAYHHFVPAAVDALLRRAEFYTAYTPYQPEIAQGTLQAIFEYQTLICALTGMDAANASHYDGATALAEAAMLALNAGRGRRTVVVAPTVHPQHRQVLRTYLQGLDIVVTGDEDPGASLDDVAAPSRLAAFLAVSGLLPPGPSTPPGTPRITTNKRSPAACGRAWAGRERAPAGPGHHRHRFPVRHPPHRGRPDE